MKRVLKKGKVTNSAILNPKIVKTKIKMEKQAGRIAGPFKNPPFTDFKASLLAIREKRVSGKFRLLHNLSFLYDHRSVNKNIPKDKSTITYSNILDVISVIQDCSPDAYLVKSDIADTFRLIPLHPSQYHLTGFCWQGQYYYDLCLPQGCSYSCKIF